MTGLVNKQPQRHARISSLLSALILIVTFAGGRIDANAQSFNHAGVYSVPEPENLGILQDSIRAYIKSGAYESGIADVVDSAKVFIESRYKKVRNPAIVLDVDETSLPNIRFEYEYSFGYSRDLWTAWVKKSDATAIKPTLQLAKWAASRHIAIFFITGRGLLSTDLSADPTVVNLKRVGYPKWAAIYFKTSSAISTAEFKTHTRREIESQGYTIVANIGDQYSDLVGGYAEGKFKLPDPMYFIP